MLIRCSIKNNNISYSYCEMVICKWIMYLNNMNSNFLEDLKDKESTAWNSAHIIVLKSGLNDCVHRLKWSNYGTTATGLRTIAFLWSDHYCSHIDEHMKSLIPKGVISFLHEHSVVNITVQVTFWPSYKVYFRFELLMQICIGNCIFHLRIYKQSQNNLIFSKVEEVNLTPFGKNNLHI